jgi:nucleolar protein 9
MLRVSFDNIIIEAFITNSFSQTEGKEVDYSSNQMVSRVLETLLPSANADILLRFMKAFTPQLRTICADPFSSHVLEKLLEIASSDKWLENKDLTKWFEQTCQFVLNNFEEFTFDNYANHVMRKVCQCLSGFVVETGQGGLQGHGPKQSLSANKETKMIYGERQKNPMREQMLRDFYLRFLNWPQYFDLFKTDVTSGFVQSLLKTYHRVDPKGVKDGVAKTLKAMGDELNLNSEKDANLHTRTIEACLCVVGEKGWNKIFKLLFQGKLADIGIHAKGRFSLKKLFETCPSKEMVID